MVQKSAPMHRLLGAVALSLFAAACSSGSDASTDEDPVIVDTRTRAARAQYDLNAGFARSYVAQCRPSSHRPRVLVSGFGRFLDVADNATGRIVSELTGVPYPETREPAPGQVDPPAPKVSVGGVTLSLPGVGPVDVCAMILPVDWDLASILIAKEADAFQPSFVMMNGVAGDRQPLWFELGSMNRAARSVDGTNLLVPTGNGNLVPLVDDGELGRPNLLAWSQVQEAARATIAGHADDVDGGERFGDILPDAVLAGFPRSSNTYLCNNTTYVTGYLMDHPGQTVSLLRSSTQVRGSANDVPVTMRSDLRSTPRVFVHWPQELASVHRAAGADVMRSILAAQLAAGPAATRGDNRQADPSLTGGDYY